MDILKIAVQGIALFTFTVSALVVREDAFNESKAATVALCFSMAALITMQ